MKTLMLFEGSEGASFFELAGDLSRFHDVYINAEVPEGVVHTSDEYEALQEELTDIIFDETGEMKLDEIEAPTKDWDFFIRCGLID
jgi:hypothetical protein